jgi:hypothetical protein
MRPPVTGGTLGWKEVPEYNPEHDGLRRRSRTRGAGRQRLAKPQALPFDGRAWAGWVSAGSNRTRLGLALSRQQLCRRIGRHFAAADRLGAFLHRRVAALPDEAAVQCVGLQHECRVLEGLVRLVAELQHDRTVVDVPGVEVFDRVAVFGEIELVIAGRQLAVSLVVIGNRSLVAQRVADDLAYLCARDVVLIRRYGDRREHADRGDGRDAARAEQHLGRILLVGKTQADAILGRVQCKTRRALDRQAEC